MNSTHYDLLGLLTLSYGDYGNTDLILADIEAVLPKLGNFGHYPAYLAIIVAHFYQIHVQPLHPLPNITLLLYSMGIKIKRFVYHKRRLIEMNILPARHCSNFMLSAVHYLTYLGDQFDFSENMINEALESLARPGLWVNIEPKNAVCCAIMAIRFQKKKPLQCQKLARCLKLSHSSVYGSFNRVFPELKKRKEYHPSTDLQPVLPILSNH